MFRFIKKCFFTAMTFFSYNVLSVNSLECVTMSNQKCEIRILIDVNNNELVSYPFSIKVNKCGGSCNNINDPYAKFCVPNVIKNINVSNQTRHIEWHEACKYKCRLDSSVCNNKQFHQIE